MIFSKSVMMYFFDLLLWDIAKSDHGWKLAGCKVLETHNLCLCLEKVSKQRQEMARLRGRIRTDTSTPSGVRLQPDRVNVADFWTLGGADNVFR